MLISMFLFYNDTLADSFERTEFAAVIRPHYFGLCGNTKLDGPIVTNSGGCEWTGAFQGGVCE